MGLAQDSSQNKHGVLTRRPACAGAREADRAADAGGAAGRAAAGAGERQARARRAAALVLARGAPPAPPLPPARLLCCACTASGVVTSREEDLPSSAPSLTHETLNAKLMAMQHIVKAAPPRCPGFVVCDHVRCLSHRFPWGIAAHRS